MGGKGKLVPHDDAVQEGGFGGGGAGFSPGSGRRESPEIYYHGKGANNDSSSLFIAKDILGF